MDVSKEVGVREQRPLALCVLVLQTGIPGMRGMQCMET